MATINGNPGASTTIIRAPNLTDHNYTFTYRADEVVSSPEFIGQTTTDDVLYDTGIAATVDTVGEVSLEWVVPVGITNQPTVTYENFDPTVATLQSDNSLTWVSDGVCRVVADSGLLRRTVSVPISRAVGASASVFNSYVAGSFGKNQMDMIDAAIAGKTASTARRMFSTFDTTTLSFIRNTGFWAKDILDVTPVSAWSNPSNYTGAQTLRAPATLISPIHVIMANHYHVGYVFGEVSEVVDPTNTVYFVTADNQLITRTVTAVIGTSIGNDICIGKLDSEVPASIGFARFMPNNWWTTKAPGWQDGQIPAIGFKRHWELNSLADVEWTNFPNASDGNYSSIYGRRHDDDDPKAAFWLNAIGGDSGHPFCFVVDGQMALVTHWTNSAGNTQDPTDQTGYGIGYNYTLRFTEINEAMATLGGGYSLTEADLSSFNTY